MTYDATMTAIVGANIKGFTDGMNTVQKETKATESVINGTTASATSKINNFSKTVGKTMTVAGASITAVGAKSLVGFGQFEQSLNTAAVIAGGTSKDIEGLAAVANKMGAELPLSAKEAADAMVAMARDGASISTIKEEFPAIAQAATAAGSDLQQTASVVQQAMNLWGDSLGTPQQAAAILVQTANASNASVEEMQQVLADVGSTATSVGYSMTDVSTAVGLLTNKGIPAAQAAQNLNNAITHMIRPNKIASGAMQELGISYYDAQGKMKPLNQVAQELSKSMEGLTDQQKNQYLSMLFGQTGYKVMNDLMQSVADTSDNTTTSWKAMSKAITDASKSGDVATQFLSNQASEMQKNVGAKIEQVGGNWEQLSNTAMAEKDNVSGAFLDMTNDALNWAASSKSPFAEITRNFLGLAPVIGPATVAVGGFLTQAGKITGVATGAANGILGIGKSAFGSVGSVLGFAGGLLNIGANAEQSIGKLSGLSGAISALGPVGSGVSGLLSVLFSPASLGLVAAGVGFWALHDAGSESMSDLITQIQNGDINGILTNIKKTFDNIVEAFKNVNWSAVIAPWSTLLDGVSNSMDVWKSKSDTAFGSDTQSKIQTTSDKIEFLVSGMEVAIGAFGALVATVVTIFSAVATVIETLVRTTLAAWYLLNGDINGAAEVMSNNVSAKFTQMSYNVGQSFLDMSTQAGQHMQALSDGTAQSSQQIHDSLTNQTALGSTNAVNNLNAAAGGGQAALNQLASSTESNANRVNTTLSDNTQIASNNTVNNLNAAASGAGTAMQNAANQAGTGATKLAGNVTNGANQANVGMNAGMTSAANTSGNKMSEAARNADSHKRDFKSAGSNAGQAVKSGVEKTSLEKAGNAIMKGFLDGLQQTFLGPVMTFIDGVAGTIAAHKGPISYDKKLLIPAGKAIMQGLGNSMTQGFKPILKSVDGFAPQIYREISKVSFDDVTERAEIAQKRLAQTMFGGNTLLSAGNIAENQTLDQDVLNAPSNEVNITVEQNWDGDKVYYSIKNKDARKATKFNLISKS